MKNQRVLVTRAAGQADAFCQMLTDVGAIPIVHPVIEIVAPADLGPLDRAIEQIESFDWVVFVSANGVLQFLDRVVQQTGSVDGIRNLRVAAIGDATRDVLQRHDGFGEVITPVTSNSESLANTLIQNATGQRIMLIRANRGSPELGRRLDAAGIEFEEVVAYRSVDIDRADPGVKHQMEVGDLDWVTVTSSAIAKSTIRMFGEALRQTKLVSISPTTTGAMEELGFKPTAEAKNYNLAGIVQAMLDHESQR